MQSSFPSFALKWGYSAGLKVKVSNFSAEHTAHWSTHGLFVAVGQACLRIVKEVVNPHSNSLKDTKSRIRPTGMRKFRYFNITNQNVIFKGTNGRQKTYEISHVYSIFYSGFMCQTTVIFGITKAWKSVLNTLASWNCFTCRNLFQNGANDMSECLTFETAFCKKLNILNSSDHLILIKFRQLVVNNAKLSVKSWCFDRVFDIAVANADIGSLKCHL